MSQSSLAQHTPATTPRHEPQNQAQNQAHVLERIGDALRGLRYGAVTVIVQDGVVVQVDRTEKLRFSRP